MPRNRYIYLGGCSSRSRNLSLQPYLAQANSAKREYDVVRKEYDERLRSLQEYIVTSIMVYPTSESPTTPRESSDDATIHE